MAAAVTRPGHAAGAYLLATGLVSYLVWGPWDGVDPRPFSWPVDAAVLVCHVLAGAAIRRWWALALPLAWAVISIPAGGYDVPVSTGIAFQTPFLWAPALALGILGSKLALRKVVRSS